MGQIVTAGASLKCSYGTFPSTLNVSSQTKCIASGKPIATIKDTAFNMNIPAFGMCTSMLNPQVQAATTAALGILTPQPCTLMAAGTWICKSHCIVGGTPCLTSEGELVCTLGGGSITVATSGQTKAAVK